MIAQPASILHLVTTSRILHSVLQNALERTQGLSMHVHTSVEACVAAISTPPAAIIVDYLLRGRPASAGLQALSRHAAAESAPVWLLHSPAAAAQASRLQSEHPNVRRVIQKPFAEGELLRGLQDLVSEPARTAASPSPVQPVQSDLPPDLTRFASIPSIIGSFQWQSDTGAIQASSDAARRLGNATSFCLQLSTGVAEAAGLGELRELHLFARDSNAALCTSRVARPGAAPAMRVTGLLASAYQGTDEVIAQARPLL